MLNEFVFSRASELIQTKWHFEECATLYILSVDTFFSVVVHNLTTSPLLRFSNFSPILQQSLQFSSPAYFPKMSSFVGNPLLTQIWSTPYQIPPFEQIRPVHFREAFPVCMSEHKAEVSAIVDQARRSPMSFEASVAAFDRSGFLLKRARRVFSNICSSNSSEELQQLQREFAGPLALHDSEVYMSGLFEALSEVHGSRTNLGLSSEAVRLTERLHLDFIREGACFEPAAQEIYKTIKQRLAELTTQFTQNVLGDEAEVCIPLKQEAGELDGLPAFLVAACESAAAASGKGERHIVTLSRSLVVPFLMFSDKRELREKAW